MLAKTRDALAAVTARETELREQLHGMTVAVQQAQKRADEVEAANKGEVKRLGEQIEKAGKEVEAAKGSLQAANAKIVRGEKPLPGKRF